MKHIKSHRLADLASGNWLGKTADRARTHIENCSQCAGALKRVGATQGAMADIASSDSPELNWDHIATRIYWSTSSERRASERGLPTSSWGIKRSVGLACALSACALGGFWLITGDKDSSSASLAAVLTVDVSTEEAKSTPVSMKTAPAPIESGALLRGVVTFAGEGIAKNAKALDFDKAVVVGDNFVSGDSALVVQFGLHNAFRLAPQSELWLRSFDEKSVVLEVAGLVDIDIAKRLPGQEFVVRAGEQSVVVHGTAFRVDMRDSKLDVSCTRGKVVVTDGLENVSVPAGQQFAVSAGEWQSAALRSLPIAEEDLEDLDAAMAMPLLPTWDPGNARQIATSSVLRVGGTPGQEVALDGIVLGSGSFWVRTNSGRHQLARVADDGSLEQGEWIETAPGDRRAAKAKVAKAKTGKAAKHRLRKLRKTELSHAIAAKGKAERCLAPLAKQGLMAGSYVELEVGVNADGSQRYLNLTGSNLSPAVQRCVRSAVASLRLKRGAETEFSIRLDY